MPLVLVLLTRNSVPAYGETVQILRSKYPMISKEAERVHQESLIIEGHRDVFEMVRLKRSGENFPVLNKIMLVYRVIISRHP